MKSRFVKKIIKLGKFSHAIIIPPAIMKLLNLNIGDNVIVEVEKYDQKE